MSLVKLFSRRKAQQNGVVVSQDDLQNQIILLEHHLDDAEKSAQSGDDMTLRASLDDAAEIVEKLKKMLSEQARSSAERAVE